MIRLLKLIAALATALVLGAVAVQPAFAATRASGPTPSPTSSPGGSDPGQQLTALEQQLQQQQATVDKLATQVESEQASVNTLNSKVASDRKQEKQLNQRMDAVARIEYERPALSLTTILQAKNVDQLLTGVSQSRLIAEQQHSLFDASKALKAKDQAAQAAAKAQLAQISKQKSQATSIAATTQSEITTLQVQQAAAQGAGQGGGGSRPAATESGTPSFSAGGGITLQAGPSNPNRFAAGNCTWYVAQIYSIPWLGNANQWPSAAAASGQAEGQTPIVGAIMESADSGYGHVSVVTSVASADQWTVTEMNYLGYNVVDTRQVDRGSSNLVTFIY